MAFKQKLSKMTGIAAAGLPSSYQILGNVLLMKLPKIRSPAQKQKIAMAIMEMLPNVHTVCEIKEVRGELREPLVEKLAGESTLTTHKENDILYRLDAAQIMFSKGNLTERKRLIDQVGKDEYIVDMFAGIGYFSLNLAKYSKVREILAIEKNPVSYSFLTENISLNKLKNVNAIQGDCMVAAAGFKNHADRVLMGYFPGTERFLPAALYMARTGCVVHYHNIYRGSDIWKKPLAEIESACQKYNIKFEVLEKKKVKSYAPNVWHIVIDFRVIK